MYINFDPEEFPYLVRPYKLLPDGNPSASWPTQALRLREEALQEIATWKKKGYEVWSWKIQAVAEEEY